jgi:environmental stress-induced protein Ves
MASDWKRFEAFFFRVCFLAMHVVRKSAFTAVPWKNGGGITHEVIRVPSVGEFSCRVSVAEIARSGPFSDFTGYARSMILLRGAGIRLTFAGHQTKVLREVGDSVDFDGATPTECELLDGPCTDFNLMVSKSIRGVRAWVERLDESRPVASTASGALLVFAIDGALILESGSETARLDPWDFALMASLPSVSVRAATIDDPPALVFFATVDDNSLLNHFGNSSWPQMQI